MKQNITVEQLNELSEKGKEKLWSWLNPKTMELEINGNKKYIPVDVNYLLSIGQMIEFLDERYIITNRNKAWRVWSRHTDNRMIENEELCDALWLAVKEILEK